MEISNISKSFEGKVVFSSLNLHIHEGCTTIISGASGIGKTTLFNLILGLEEPDGGDHSKAPDARSPGPCPG